ncbi:TetR/AcrR family transcriptional regulator [Streptomyces sp. NRRL F-5126]|uniref:TetR/AcrR family transcriptional regulator n=1 Tax=Streptomyces sp. NRRL F-5126 TaxID=1463857 RepID=UPI0004C81193|nr:TetR/AcrR family transcriptional regulator [Streptomyces sp. NRRL F-5126]
MSDEQSRPRRLTRAETKARTRALLLEAAAQVFARKGYAGASVDDIAETAGFSTGALYSNFKNKDELFIELLSSRSTSRLSEAVALVSGQFDSAEGTQEAMSRYLVEVADNEMDFAALQAEFWLYAIRRPEFRESLAAQFCTYRDDLAAVLAERAKSRGRAVDAPFDHVATVLLTLFQGLARLRRTDPELVPDDLYGEAAHWLFVGLGASFEAPGKKD